MLEPRSVTAVTVVCIICKQNADRPNRRLYATLPLVISKQFSPRCALRHAIDKAGFRLDNRRFSSLRGKTLP
jgi:hypothetical protein